MLVAGGVGTAFSVATFIVYKFIVPLFTVANHKRVRSVCCGKSCVSSFDVEETTPTVVSLRQVDPGVQSPRSGVGGSGVASAAAGRGS